MPDDPRLRRRAMLAELPPAEAAELLARSALELAEDICAWSETPLSKAWTQETHTDIAHAHLITWTVQLVNAWHKLHLENDPPDPEGMN